MSIFFFVSHVFPSSLTKVCCITLGLALSLAETGSGHRGGAAGSVELCITGASGFVYDSDDDLENSENQPENQSSRVSQLETGVTNHTVSDLENRSEDRSNMHVKIKTSVPSHSVTPAKHRDTRPPASPLPPGRSTPAVRIPPKSKDSDLLVSSSVIECFQVALSRLMSHNRRDMYGTEQFSQKFIMCTLVVIGLLLSVCVCLFCYHMHCIEDEPFEDQTCFGDHPTEMTQAVTFRQATTTLGRALTEMTETFTQATTFVVEELSKRRHRFTNWITSLYQRIKDKFQWAR